MKIPTTDPLHQAVDNEILAKPFTENQAVALRRAMQFVLKCGGENPIALQATIADMQRILDGDLHAAGAWLSPPISVVK